MKYGTLKKDRICLATQETLFKGELSMRKWLALLICLLLAVSVPTSFVVYGEQETATASPVETAGLSTLELVRELRDTPLVKDLWVPVLPEQYQIQSVTVTPHGSYYFTVRSLAEDASDTEMRISFMVADARATAGDIISPFRQYLKEYGYSTVSTSTEVLDTMFPLDYVNYKDLVYVCTGDFTKGQYGEYGATAISWVTGQMINLEYDVYQYDQVQQEILLNLTPNLVASVLYSSPDNGQDVFTQFQTTLGLAFATYGDVDGNWKVNAKDALAILKHGVQLQPITHELSLLLADCNNDFQIDALDALYTLKKAVFK